MTLFQLKMYYSKENFSSALNTASCPLQLQTVTIQCHHSSITLSQNNTKSKYQANGIDFSLF